MKKKNSYQRILERYREYLKKYIQEEEVRAALDVPLDKLNLNNVVYYSAYYHGARAALRLAADWFEPYLKGGDKVYVRAALELAMKDLRHTELFMNGQPMRYRNNEYKGKKLVKCEAYFYEEVKMRLEVEP